LKSIELLIGHLVDFGTDELTVRSPLVCRVYMGHSRRWLLGDELHVPLDEDLCRLQG